MNINNIIALEEVLVDLKIAEEFYEKQNIVAVLDLRQNPKNMALFISNRTNEKE